MAHRPRPRAVRDLITLAAVGFGTGLLPVAPGTWGSCLGLFLGLSLGQTMPLALAAGILLAALPLCVWCCTHAERAFKDHDPVEVVLDEVWAMAAIVVGLPWIQHSAALLVIAFLLFRLFDTQKPAPLKRLARLPGGWGVMADDVGAAAYVIGLLWIIWLGATFK